MPYTKTTLLAAIDDHTDTVKRLTITKKEVATDEDSGDPTVNAYVVEYLQNKNSQVRKRCVGFYVVDEGAAGEVAYFREQPGYWS